MNACVGLTHLTLCAVWLRAVACVYGAEKYISISQTLIYIYTLLLFILRACLPFYLFVVYHVNQRNRFYACSVCVCGVCARAIDEMPMTTKMQPESEDKFMRFPNSLVKLFLWPSALA